MLNNANVVKIGYSNADEGLRRQKKTTRAGASSGRPAAHAEVQRAERAEGGDACAKSRAVPALRICLHDGMRLICEQFAHDPLCQRMVGQQ